MAEASNIRLVRCPMCGNLLPEPPDYSLYRCGGCDAVLRACGLGSLSERGKEDTEFSGNEDRVRVEENVDLVRISSSLRTEKKESLFSNDDAIVGQKYKGLGLGRNNFEGEISYFDNRRRQFLKHPIGVQLGEDDEDMNLNMSRSVDSYRTAGGTDSSNDLDSCISYRSAVTEQNLLSEDQMLNLIENERQGCTSSSSISKADEQSPDRVIVRDIKRSFRDFPKSTESTENGRPSVLVNGQHIPDHLLKKAKKFAGPIEPGDYWYDFRAGFWGVMGQPCIGIIPPYIEEFDHPMPASCAAGNTGVFVNGRELHQLDLDRLTSRGLPVMRNKQYIIELNGRVVDENSGDEVVCLGKLAPTVEKAKRGFGMRVRKVAL